MQRLILRHKKYLLFILLISILSLLLGFYYFNIIDNDIKLTIIDSIKNNNIGTNYIFKDLLLTSTILVSSFFIIGSVIGIVYYVYNLFIIGFIINIFITIYKSKGILYILVYLIINRLIPLLLFVIFIYKVINISIYTVKYILNKKYVFKEKIYVNFKNSIYIIIFILLMNIISYVIIPLFKI